ncbi:MAG: hypothetical protein RMK50_07175, partial [Nitrososphaerota archaeon]|nr:hypothetical protein [Candidatus Bathyarchaeota archaeon]MDW8194580.1 hypothetical protein [Nitrososphaerota archaeon]
MKFAVFVTFCLLTIAALCALKPVYAASLQSASLEVFVDGVARFKGTIIIEENEASVTVPILASEEHLYNVLVADEKGSMLAYDINGQNMVIYSLDAMQVTLEYDTDVLTSKSGGLWTLAFTSPFEIEVLLPRNSTIVYINAAPMSLKAEGDTVRLKLSPGYWEICYEVGVQSHVPTPQPQPVGWPFEWLILGAAGA